MEYKRPDVDLKIYREALARFTEFSNLRLGVYTPYAHENSNQSLIINNEIWNYVTKFAKCVWHISAILDILFKHFQSKELVTVTILYCTTVHLTVDAGKTMACTKGILPNTDLWFGHISLNRSYTIKISEDRRFNDLQTDIDDLM